jgi:hypothetical protein
MILDTKIVNFGVNEFNSMRGVSPEFPLLLLACGGRSDQGNNSKFGLILDF